MFAVFLSDKMDPFYQICMSFPNVIFFCVLVLCLFYWLIAVLGLVSIDIFNFDIPDGDAGDGITDLNVMAGIIMKLGLNGVPFIIVLTLISLSGWFISFFGMYSLVPRVPTDLLQFVASVCVFIGSTYLAVVITALIIRPLRPVFIAADQHVETTIIGQVGIVRTGRADKAFGEAEVADGGAGLIVKIPSYKDEVFKKGDRVILLEYHPIENIYKVISEEDFVGHSI